MCTAFVFEEPSRERLLHQQLGHHRFLFDSSSFKNITNGLSDGQTDQRTDMGRCKRTCVSKKSILATHTHI